MVIGHSSTIWVGSLLLAQQETESVLERLDPPRRAAVLMALLALVLTGLVLVTCVMIGARWVRRMARHRPNTKLQTTSIDHREKTSLGIARVAPETKTGDTIRLGHVTGETHVES